MGNLSEITGSGWDAEAEAKKGGFDPLPDGMYVVMVAKSDIRQSKSSDGKYAAMEYEVVEGEYKGRKVFENLNLWNSNSTAVSIAKAALGNLQLACRLPKISDTSELHGIPFVLKVGQKKDKDTGEIRQTVKGYLPKGADMNPVAATSGGTKATPF